MAATTTEDGAIELDDELLREAELIVQRPRLIRRALLRAFDEDKRRAGLTAPQTHAVVLLVVARRAGHDGLTIGQLRARMGLAQSPVSSLVERLERKQLVRRVVDPADRRYTRIVLTEAVASYLKQAGRARRLLGPLIAILRQTTSSVPSWKVSPSSTGFF